MPALQGYFLLGSVRARTTPRKGFIPKTSELIFTKGKMFKVHYPDPKCCLWNWELSELEKINAFLMHVLSTL